MVSEQVAESSILELWGRVIEILNSVERLDEVTGERDLMRRQRTIGLWSTRRSGGC
jgi:hypothetical protein